MRWCESAWDLAAFDAVRESGRKVGSMPATCVNLLHRELILIGRLVVTAGEHFLAGIRETVYARSLPLATQHLRIVATRTSERAGELRAPSLVTAHTLSPENVNVLLQAG